MTDHPISPPPELVEQWRREPEYAYDTQPKTMVTMTTDRLMLLSKKSAQYGADQELEACCEWFQEFYKTESWVKHDLKHFRAARRPKPPSLKEQALKTLHSMQIEPCVINRKGLDGVNTYADLMAKYDILRRALEALPND